ncbi:MAG: T9SS C-terminal target domain-containing protein [Bacteroidetes bacterium]|nr:MAG: T9SS C-terminal target domain-containing protein [Bacteroidota bacterium]
MGLGIYSSGRRVFLGGGGGGGQQNNSVGSAGGNGGGIILLKAQEILTTGTGTALISANGNNSLNAGNDGVGGAGAGGSIVLEIQTWNVVNTFPINVRANGGNGGSVNSVVHGGGGGGGQGLVIFSGAIPTNNITSSTNNGTGGCNDSGCSSSAQNGMGANNQGLFGNVGTALPMTLKSFTATLETEKVRIAWEVAAYQPILYFEVQSSTDAINWLSVARVEASAQNLAYQTWDKDDFVNVRYYRLKQVEHTQETAYSNVVAVHKKLRAEDVLLYPNPATQNTYLEIANPKTYTITVKNVLGQAMRLAYQYRENGIVFDLQNAPKGMYFISLSNKIQSITKKLCVQ